MISNTTRLGIVLTKYVTVPILMLVIMYVFYNKIKEK